MENEIMNCMKSEESIFLTKLDFNTDDKISQSFSRPAPDSEIRFKQCTFFIYRIII